MKETLKSYNPADGTLIGEVPVASDGEISEAVLRAKRAQVKWAALDID